MRHYIADLSVLRLLKDNYFPEIFKRLWKVIDERILNGTVVIIEPVYEEIKNGSEEDFLIQHLRKLKEYHGWSPAELPEGIEDVVRRITKKFEGRISYTGNEADPYIVGYALVKNKENKLFEYEYVVLTAEKYKPNSAKIPNMCEEFKVPYIFLRDFLKEIGYSDEK